MSPLRTSSICFATLATAFFTGCVNPYAAYYVAEGATASLADVPSTSKAPPQVMETAHLRAAILRLKARGYVVLAPWKRCSAGYLQLIRLWMR
jgi:PBP1b-binding outer membrane lipoprotein LpoB